MSQPQGRGLFRVIWQNFIKSLTPGVTRGDLMGKDHLGTKYFEIPANPKIGKRKPSRWFETVPPEKFDQEIPVEWEAWLRGRRSEPPTEEELMRNLAIKERTIANARELEKEELQKKGLKPEDMLPPPERKGAFPIRKEYEVRPGVTQDKDDK